MQYQSKREQMAKQEEGFSAFLQWCNEVLA
jgi:hypothetical protein